MKPVTPTEWKILQLIAEGHSTNDVATVLGISKFTVMSHRRNLLLKFDASNSAELVRKALETNGSDLLEPND